MFINIQQLLGGNVIRKHGSDFISITKRVTNETMGRPDMNLFTQEEIEVIRSQPFIESVAPLVSNDFRVQLSAGEIFAFKTDLFLESLDNEFIDTVPPAFSWEEGQMNIPIIISSDFLEAYNVFAPAQDLPQVSQETASSIPVLIVCQGMGREVTFRGQIVAFSDRITSILVPKNFLNWANGYFGTGGKEGHGRLYIKTGDANNAELLNFFEENNYKVNKDRVRFAQQKRILQGIFSGLGVFGLLVVLMALMLFSFYLQLVIARSKDNLALLLLLGYSPDWLGKNVSRQFIPVYIFIVLMALALTQLMQWAFHHYVMFDRPELNTMVHWIVLSLSVLLVGLSIFTNHRLVRKLLYKLY